MIKFFKGKG